MLRIRIDDVLVKESSCRKDPQKRFAQICRWLEQTPHIKHVPTILVEDIQKYPETIELIKLKTSQGKMFPELHGWEHVDYNKLTETEIAKHLFKSIRWFENMLGIRPTIWATPWGAEGEKLSILAGDFGLTVEGVASCWDPGKWLNETSKQDSPIMGVTVMDHWWTTGLRLLRISAVVQHNSFSLAKEKRYDLWPK